MTLPFCPICGGHVCFAQPASHLQFVLIQALDRHHLELLLARQLRFLPWHKLQALTESDALSLPHFLGQYR
jgi:hypothetical protein